VDAEDLLMRELLGVRGDELTEQTARWIRSRQRADGSWATFHAGPGDLSTTVEAYAALRLAGDRPEDEHLVRAGEFVHAHGGIEASRTTTRIWLALLDEWPWRDLPAIPPELVLLPRWAPLHLDGFAAPVRQLVVPLSILRALRPIRSGTRLDLDGLRAGTRRRYRRPSLGTAVNRLLRGYERHPAGAVRRHALRRAAEWIIARQEEDGSWGGSTAACVACLVALYALGYPINHPVLRTGLAALERSTIREDSEDGPLRRLEAGQSPVRDSALALIALRDAGLPADHPAVLRTAGWLLQEEVLVPGDWAAHRPDLEPSGWALGFDNDQYPDTDDTAEAMLALGTVFADVGALRRGTDWLLGMQRDDGGWGAFDPERPAGLASRLPLSGLADAEADASASADAGVRAPAGGRSRAERRAGDPASPDVTAHAIEALCARGQAASEQVREAVSWLLTRQRPDGSWPGRFGVNHVYGTGCAVPALVAAGVGTHTPPVRRAVAWLEWHQNPDGGWGEDPRSRTDENWAGRGISTASQTAWALLALQAAGESGSQAAGRGVNWLIDTQCSDGSWEERFHTAFGLAGTGPARCDLYRLVYPLRALGRIWSEQGHQAG
jgi:squalene-hopene/tetraprenyl-beta-curcumene cyclase